MNLSTQYKQFISVSMPEHSIQNQMLSNVGRHQILQELNTFADVYFFLNIRLLELKIKLTFFKSSSYS